MSKHNKLHHQGNKKRYTKNDIDLQLEEKFDEDIKQGNTNHEDPQNSKGQVADGLAINGSNTNNQKSDQSQQSESIQNGAKEVEHKADNGTISQGETSQESLKDTNDSKLLLMVDSIVNEVNENGEALIAVGERNSLGPNPLKLDELDQVLLHLKQEANQNKMDLYELQRYKDSTIESGQESWIADILARQRAGKGPPVEIRVAIIGNVDSGKSTMVGVLTRAMLDDGRGAARSKVFTHQHESVTGRTSTIGLHNLCIGSSGNILNDSMFKTNTCGDYVSRSSKLISMVDLAGHEKYFKTTAYGLTGHLPDYACVIVGANAGLIGMCKEHLGVAVALKLPFFFVITKIDMTPPNILEESVTKVQAILKKPGVRKKPFMINNVNDVLTCARYMHSNSLAPIFLTSAVTGQGLDLIRIFYNLLPSRQRWAQRHKEMAEFVIDETFGVPGVGTVVAGTLKKGQVTPSSNLLLGPDIGDGTFKQVGIKSIHYKRLPVDMVSAGQTAALALKRIKRNQVRKGMVMVDTKSNPKASWGFEADIAILTHSTTIQPRYQAVIHCEIIRQSARVVAMDKERLRSGDRATVQFKFLQRPEYIQGGTRFVFREGKTKGVGVILSVDNSG